MEFRAAIELSPEQIREMIQTYLSNKGVYINSSEDIVFKVSKQERGSQIDPYTVYEFTGAKINNIKVGK